MKLLLSLFAVVMLTAIQPTQADASELIYRISGVTDNGGASNVGVATVVHCTNFAATPQAIKVGFRNAAGAFLWEATITPASNATATWSTHSTLLFSGEVFVGANVIQQGSATVDSASRKVHCSAMVVDAGASTVRGMALHMARYNPLLDTQE